MMDTLSRLVPHTRDVYFRTFDQYGDAIWPAQIVVYALCLFVLYAAIRPFPGSGRIVATILGAAWTWTGIAFQILTYGRINWLAWPMGILLVVQGSAFLLDGTIRNRIDFQFTASGPVHYYGVALAAVSLIVYPLAESSFGFGLHGVGTVGLAPGPTTLFTAGLLLLTKPRPRLLLFLVPIIWSAIAGITGWVLMVPQNIWLPAAVLIAFLLGVGSRLSAGQPKTGAL
jgi:hypothetical protein